MSSKAVAARTAILVCAGAESTFLRTGAIVADAALENHAGGNMIVGQAAAQGRHARPPRLRLAPSPPAARATVPAARSPRPPPRAVAQTDRHRAPYRALSSRPWRTGPRRSGR